MRSRLVVILSTLALVGAACGGSSDSASTDTGAPPTDSTADEPVATEPAEPEPTEPTEPAEPEPTEPEPTEPAEPEPTEPAAIEPEVTEPAATEPAATEPAVTDATSVDDDPFGDPFAMFDPASIDDVPFCQAYGAVFGVMIGIGFAGGFDALDPDNAPTSETYEMAAYPTLLDDVAVLEASAPAIMREAFAPLFERITSAPGYLKAAGFTDAEIAALAESENIQLDDNLDPRLAEAGALLALDLGPFADVFEGLEGPATPEDEAEFEAFFLSTCPVLASAFDEF